MQTFLSCIERWGNRLPHPTALFVILCIIIVAVSALAEWVGVSATSPTSGEVIVAKSLFSREGLQYFLGSAVKNFVTFAPVGTVLVAVLGLGIADHSGLLGAIIQKIVGRTPKYLLTSTIIMCGVLSSLAADSGYVILIPLAGVVFIRAGKHPIAGIAAAFAGVSAGFSANLILGPFDAILAGLSQEAVKLVEDDYTVSIAGNYYFTIASTFLITLVASAVCHCYTDKQTADITYEVASAQKVHSNNNRGLKAALITSLILLALILTAVLPQDGLLRGDNGSLVKSPLSQGIVVIIALWAGICGTVYGLAAGTYSKMQDAIVGMEQQVSTLAGYLVLMFFAAQLVNFFSWTQLGVLLAVGGANTLQSVNLPLPFLLVSFVFLAAFINLFIGSASAKWALLAPIFVPMLFLLGISPEATQMAFRIGDSATNIITPLMPYFGVVIAFMQKYNRDIGAGTITALMLPYSLALLASWTLLLGVWILLAIPLGPNVETFISP